MQIRTQKGFHTNEGTQNRSVIAMNLIHSNDAFENLKGKLKH